MKKIISSIMSVFLALLLIVPTTVIVIWKTF